MNLSKLHVLVSSVAPIVLHNGRLSNPLDPYVIAMKRITGKRKKTEEDHALLARLEWEGGLYADPDIGVALPAEVIDAAIAEGAKRTKQGKNVKASVICLQDHVPLNYDGPKWPKGTVMDGKTLCNPALDKLYAATHFQHRARVGMACVMRTRPLFTKWSCEFDLQFDPSIVNRDDLIEVVQNTGRLAAIGDWRPRYGRFDAKCS